MSRKLLLRLGGTSLSMTYERRGERVALDLGGRRFEADVSRDGFWFQVRSGGIATRCAVARGRRGLWVSCEGRSFLLEEERAETASKGAPSADELRAPMTGRVVQVAAEAGAVVSEGDLLVTIEAMKMEFRLVAPEDGVIAEVRCEAGARVELGDLLVVLEPRA
jgi:acetyl/propionyl-CoA carboxylase alpha subunit